MQTMTVLAIISSPRKKNTYNAIKAIEEVHRERCDCEYDYLFLNKIDLQPCNGCHLCLTKGEEYCPLKDDRDSIVERIESADAVILASPNHTINVNWRMKNYIDRFSYLMHRPRYFWQRFMILITSGSYQGIKQATNALAPMASGGRVVSRIGIMNSPDMNDRKTEKQAQKLRREATKFVNTVSKPSAYKPRIGDLVWFAVFKALNKEEGKHSAADYRYYAQKEFFVDIDLSFGQRALLRTFRALFAALIRIGLV